MKLLTEINKGNKMISLNIFFNIFLLLERLVARILEVLILEKFFLI